MSETPLIYHVSSVLEYFRTVFRDTATKQRLKVAESTEHYIVTLLTQFSRSEKLYTVTPTGAYRAPLMTELLSEALEAASPAVHDEKLKRLGDVALFTAGFFAGSFARKLVDVDYYVGMGQAAYGSLADGACSRAFKERRTTFAEITQKFLPLTDALTEIAEGGQVKETDVLRTYEVWMKTGSARAQEKLIQAGVHPVRHPMTQSN
jgi:hypothetical protein